MACMISTIPAFKDNYIWCLEDEDAGRATVVDPGDAEPVIRHLDERGVTLAAILVTHHHGDHTGGIARLKQHWPGAVVYGPAGERIPGRDHALAEGDRVEVAGSGGPLTVIDVPGHTRGHIAYHGGGCLFCGDLLFACGSGAVFEGTPGQMFESLEKLRALPEETRVYCAHEYTLENLDFAHHVEPASKALQKRDAEAREWRRQGLPTVPSILKEEFETNPFLRSHVPEVRDAARKWSGRSLDSPAEVFAAVRAWKDALD
ncbi:MAG: hydroxyacylglutathione hydrolase [Pseudomonadota bacterium]